MTETYERALHTPVPEIPADIRAALSGEGTITPIPFGEKNRILQEESLWQEVGITQLEEGVWLVAMTCPMPGITPDMLRWWFWWHPQEDIRYQVWFPGAHKGISYRRQDAPYFHAPKCPAFQDNVQYPTEVIGGRSMPLSIAFTTPGEFGFSEASMEEHHIPLILCGHVGILKGAVLHTEMAHIFHAAEDTGTLISRFWIGQSYRLGLFRRKIFSRDMALGMAEHCCQEYRNLTRILPELYSQYAD